MIGDLGQDMLLLIEAAWFIGDRTVAFDLEGGSQFGLCHVDLGCSVSFELVEAQWAAVSSFQFCNRNMLPGFKDD